MNVIKEIDRLNTSELFRNVKDTASWHAQYNESAYVYVGGLPYQLTEGDLIAVFSQYGEIVDLNLVREKQTGKSKGFAFVAYEDQKSTVLAVDNFNGTKMLGRTLRVDHVAKYREDKKDEDFDEEAELKRKMAILPPHLRPADYKDEEAGSASESSESEDNEAKHLARELDEEDPMRAYMLKKAMKKAKKTAKRDKKEKKKDKKEKNVKKETKIKEEPKIKEEAAGSDWIGGGLPSQTSLSGGRRSPISSQERGVEDSAFRGRDSRSERRGVSSPRKRDDLYERRRERNSSRGSMDSRRSGVRNDARRRSSRSPLRHRGRERDTSANREHGWQFDRRGGEGNLRRSRSPPPRLRDRSRDR